MESVDQYFQKMPAERRVQAKAVYELILELFPQVRLSLKYKRPTYESDQGWLAVGNQKNYGSVYTCSPDKIERYVKRHPHIQHGKGCLNFKKKDKVDLDAMAQVFHKALAEESVRK